MIERFANKLYEEGKVNEKHYYESKDYGECVEETAAGASENNCDYLITEDVEGVYTGFLLKGE